MDRTADYGQVEQIIRDAVDGSGLPCSFRRLLYIPMSQRGKVLGGAPVPRWPSLVFASCAASGGSIRAAARVAAAVEIFISALDALDEVEDGDDSPLVEAAGASHALNASTALMLLAQQTLNRLSEDGIPTERVPQFTHVLTHAGLTAAGGQYRDLAAEGRGDVSTEDALDIARQKAGALMAGACKLGAMLGTSDQELLGLYETWGYHYGTMAQLVNDFHDAIENTKSDARRAKATLPLLYGRDLADAPTEESQNSAMPVEGALHFTWVVVEVERQAAMAVLAQLSDRGQSVDQLAALMG